MTWSIALVKAAGGLAKWSYPSGNDPVTNPLSTEKVRFVRHAVDAPAKRLPRCQI
ncbi:hypothetical protein [Brachybacterium fresconis]|uniref:Uncharacterized protein n=1 Tax=Brachybacterium fresconis TaxID=173363 RepID=A0ABS4YM23_9MICO|nr:hypothetical protein [Brachybacterium fresconis]MBP2409804.1 hypothetical protein [Brachybacterium fresconis]